MEKRTLFLEAVSLITIALFGFIIISMNDSMIKLRQDMDAIHNRLDSIETDISYPYEHSEIK